MASNGLTSISAAAFLDSIGVATHIPYTDGGYANLSRVQSNLDYLGVDQLRDGISNGENGSASLSSYVQLAKAGKKFTFIVGNGTSTNASIQSTLNTIKQLVAAVPGSVTAIEGPNEINNQPTTFNGLGGLGGAVALQKFLYSAVKSDPGLAGIAVDYFTGYSAGGFGDGPDPSKTSGLADYDTQHPYPNSGDIPANSVDPSQTLPNERGGNGAFVYTETGYTSNTSDVNGVSENVQGRYTLDLLLDAAKAGATHTDLYELMDAYRTGSPQGNAGYGLFDQNNNPKLAATGIHNLTTILADSGTAASKTVAYNVSGLPATGDSLAIGKSDGTTDIAVWAEPQLWDRDGKRELSAPTSTATVKLDGAHTVSVYDPLVGSSPIATYGSTDTVRLQVSDHPLIVAVKAATGSQSGSTDPVTPAPAPVTTPPNGPTSPGGGADKLVLGISEDAYKGDAQYTVSVDGQQVGGTRTAHASHAAGQTDTVSVAGNWGSGQHVVGVQFLNDLYNGTPSTDRNLYVSNATYDGTAVAGATHASYRANTFQFGVNGATSLNESDGSGPDKLALKISEDAYLGDAEYTVSVDGKQIGDTHTAFASHAAGKSDVLMLQGNWAPGAHDLSVNFLNDAYAGTSSTDRNLYVNGLSLNGSNVPGGSATLLSAGVQHFGFQG